jgi:hypothetical protein
MLWTSSGYQISCENCRLESALPFLNTVTSKARILEAAKACVKQKNVASMPVMDEQRGSVVVVGGSKERTTMATVPRPAWKILFEKS